ncbi:MAG TPA: DUF1579 domain-containing protein [Thermoanaerobaculia bacterium]|nr:DUF1579 domain-containing protein [Thermoanaerobaculia bacterium]
MKFFRNATALAFGAALAAGPILADDEKKPADKPPMDEKAAMELMQKLGTPGKGHKKLNALVGSWTAKTTLWMDPSKPPQESEGTSEQKWVLGGRYLEQRFEGMFMDKPFSGLGYTTYDNYKKKYAATWMDTLSTMILVMTGDFDKAGRVLTTTGKTDDFTTGKTSTIRYRTILVGPDEILWEMWGPGPDGKDFKMMASRYTRKK